MIFSNSNLQPVEEGKGQIFAELFKYNFVKMYLPDLSVYKIDKTQNEFVKQNKDELLKKAKIAKSFTHNGYMYDLGGYSFMITLVMDGIPTLGQPGLIDVSLMQKDDEKLKRIYLNPEEFKAYVYKQLFGKDAGTTWDDVKKYLSFVAHGESDKKTDIPINKLYIKDRIKELEIDNNAMMTKMYQESEKNIKFMQQMFEKIITEAEKKGANPTRVNNVKSNLDFLSKLSADIYKYSLSLYKEAHADYTASLKALLNYKVTNESYSILSEAMEMI